MAETQKVVAVLISLITSIVSCIQLNLAMLNSHAVYMKKHEYHSPSFVALNENSYCQTTRKEASEKKEISE